MANFFLDWPLAQYFSHIFNCPRISISKAYNSLDQPNKSSDAGPTDVFYPLCSKMCDFLFHLS